MSSPTPIQLTPTLEAITTNVGSSGIGVIEQQLGSNSQNNNNIIIARVLPQSSYPITAGLPNGERDRLSSASDNNNNSNHYHQRVYFNKVEFVEASQSPSAPPVCSFTLLPQEGEISAVTIFSMEVPVASENNNTNNNDDNTATTTTRTNVVFAFVGTTRGWHILLHVCTSISTTTTTTTTTSMKMIPSGNVLWMDRRVSVTAVCTSAVAPYSQEAIRTLLGSQYVFGINNNNNNNNNKPLTNPAIVVIHDSGLAAVYLADQFLAFAIQIAHRSSVVVVGVSTNNDDDNDDDTTSRTSSSSSSSSSVFTLADRLRIHQLPPDDAEVKEFYASHRKYEILPRSVVNLEANISELQQMHFTHRKFLQQNRISTAIVSSCCMIPCSSSTSSSSSSAVDGAVKLFKIQLYLASNTFGLLGASILVDCSESHYNDRSFISSSSSTTTSNKKKNSDEDDDDDENNSSNVIEKTFSSNNFGRKSSQHQTEGNTATFQEKALDTVLAFAAQTVFNNKTVADLIRMSGSAYNQMKITLSRAIETYPSCPFTLALPPPLNDSILNAANNNNNTNNNKNQSNNNSSNEASLFTTPSIHPIVCAEADLALDGSVSSSNSSSSSCCAIFFPYSDGRVFIILNDIVIRVVKGVKDCSIFWLRLPHSNNNMNINSSSSSASVYLGVFHKKRQIFEVYDVLCSPTRERITGDGFLTSKANEKNKNKNESDHNSLRVCACKLRKSFNEATIKSSAVCHALVGKSKRKKNVVENDDENTNEKQQEEYLEWEMIPRSTSIDGFGGTLCVSIATTSTKSENDPQQKKTRQEQYWIRIEDAINVHNNNQQQQTSSSSKEGDSSSAITSTVTDSSSASSLFQVPTIPLNATAEEIKNIVENILAKQKIAQQQQQQNYSSSRKRSSSSSASSRRSKTPSSRSSKKKSSSLKEPSHFFEELVQKTILASSSSTNNRNDIIASQQDENNNNNSNSNNDNDENNNNNNYLSPLLRLQSVLHTMTEVFLQYHLDEIAKKKKQENTNHHPEKDTTETANHQFHILSRPEAILLRQTLTVLDAILNNDYQKKKKTTSTTISLILPDEEEENTNQRQQHADPTTANFHMLAEEDDEDDRSSVITTATTAATSTTAAEEDDNVKKQNEEKAPEKTRKLISSQKILQQLLNWSLGVVAGTQKAIGDPSALPSKFLSTQPDPRSVHAIESILRDNDHQHGQTQRTNQTSAILDSMRKEVETLEFIPYSCSSSSDSTTLSTSSSSSRFALLLQQNENEKNFWIRETFTFGSENIRLKCPSYSSSSSTSSSSSSASLENLFKLGHVLFGSSTSSSTSTLADCLYLIRHPTNLMVSVGLRTREMSFVFLVWICLQGWSLETAMSKLDYYNANKIYEKEKKMKSTNDGENENENDINDDDMKEEIEEEIKTGKEKNKLSFKRLLTVVGACSFLDLKYLCLNCRDISWSRFLKWVCLLRISFRMDAAVRHGSHEHDDAKFDELTEVDFLCTFVRSVVALEKANEYLLLLPPRHRLSSSSTNSSITASIPFSQLCSFGGDLTSFIASLLSSTSSSSPSSTSMMTNNNSLSFLQPIHRCSNDFFHDSAVWKWTRPILNHSSRWTALYHKTIFKKLPPSFLYSTFASYYSSSSSSDKKNKQTSSASNSNFEPLPSSVFYNYSQLLALQAQNFTPMQLEQHHKAQDTVQVCSLALWLLDTWIQNNRNDNNNSKNSTRERGANKNDDAKKEGDKNNKNNNNDDDINFISDAYLTVSHLLDAIAKKATVAVPEEYYDYHDDDDDDVDGTDVKKNDKSNNDDEESNNQSIFQQQDRFKASLQDPNSIDQVLIIHLSITSAFAALVRSVLERFWPSIILAKSIETIHLQQEANLTSSSSHGGGTTKKSSSTSSSSWTSSSAAAATTFYRNLSTLLDVAEHCSYRLNYHLSRLLQVLDSDAAKAAALKAISMEDTRALASVTIAKFVSNDSALSLPIASPSLVSELNAMSQLEDRAFVPLFSAFSSSSTSKRNKKTISSENNSNQFRQKYLASSLANSIKHVCQISGSNNDSSSSSARAASSSPSAVLRIIAALRVMLKHARVFRAAARGNSLMMMNHQHHQDEEGSSSSLSSLELTPARLLLCFDDDEEREILQQRKEQKNRHDDDDSSDSDSDDEDPNFPSLESLLLKHEKSPHVRILTQLCRSISKYRSSSSNHHHHSTSTSTTFMMMKMNDYDALLEYDMAWRGGHSTNQQRSTSSASSSVAVVGGTRDIISHSAHYIWAYAMVHALQCSSYLPSSSSSSSTTNNNNTILELGQQDDLVLHDLIRRVSHKSIVSLILMRELRRRLGLIIEKLEGIVDGTASSAQGNVGNMSSTDASSENSRLQSQKSANDVLLAIPRDIRVWASSEPSVVRMAMRRKRHQQQQNISTTTISISKIFLQKCCNLASKVLELKGFGGDEAAEMKRAKTVLNTFSDLKSRFK